MSISINVIQRSDKINRNQTAPIHIRLTQKGKSRYVSTGVTLPLGAWNAETQQISPDYPSAGELQFQIENKRREYEKKIKRLAALEVEITFDTLFETNGKRVNCTVVDYLNQQIDRLRSAGKIASVTKYRFCLVALEKCCPVNIRFEQIDINYLRRFETFLSKDNESNSIATKFSVLKAVYNRAIADGVFKPQENPFENFKVGKYWKPTRKRAINKEDILRMKAFVRWQIILHGVFPRHLPVFVLHGRDKFQRHRHT